MSMLTVVQSLFDQPVGKQRVVGNQHRLRDSYELLSIQSLA